VQAVELFRYKLKMPGGREFEYVFETEEHGVPETIDQDRAEQIAIDWIMRFHGGPKIGSIESATFRQKPIPHWLVTVADTADGPIQHLLFAVILPNGVIVVPKVAERL
jgi:hypothetical protein